MLEKHADHTVGAYMFLHIKNFGDELKRYFAEDRRGRPLTLGDFEERSLLMMQEGRDWDRLVVSRKDTTGEEAVIGHTQIRKGGIAKVTGAAQFGADVDQPGQLYGAVLHSPYAHARVLRVNAEKARALPGVRAVVVGSDFPTPLWFFLCRPAYRGAGKGSLSGRAGGGGGR